MVVDAEHKIEIGRFANRAMGSGSIRELGRLRWRGSRSWDCRPSPRARRSWDGNRCRSAWYDNWGLSTADWCATWRGGQEVLLRTKHNLLSKDNVTVRSAPPSSSEAPYGL
jgi:hypothetical protein